MSAENHRQFYIPAGFAHGFLTLAPDTIFSYKCTNVYSKEHDRGMLWNDESFDIDWLNRDRLTISDKDRVQPTLASLESDPVRWDELLFTE